MKTIKKSRKKDYKEKFADFSNHELFRKLVDTDRQFITHIAGQYRLTFQEFRQLVNAARDLEMWGDIGISELWQTAVSDTKNDKKNILDAFYLLLNQQRNDQKKYSLKPERQISARDKVNVRKDDSRKKSAGMCPVASPKTVCCNLRTIDAVETCVFGCSYCTIQTFYNKDIVFSGNLDEQLQNIELDKNRYYHYGSGQSSDALAWGNKEGILDAQVSFAVKNPNVLLEFKTKSDSIRYFLNTELPPNIVCSWSLNPQVIIDHEEHFTANLDKRIDSALQIVKKGIKVSFHFHPMVYYHGWEQDYTLISRRLIAEFDPESVLFISYGSVTFIKPVLKQIRNRGFSTRITQMEFVQDPHGKLTYPDDIKTKMFRHMHESFKPWHNNVFFYLCMEKESIWIDTFSHSFESNEQFEQEFLENCFNKIKKSNK